MVGHEGPRRADGRTWPPCGTPSASSRPPPTAPRRSWPAAAWPMCASGWRAIASSLLLLRRLVPERNEVPNLLDDISTRSKIRGVTLSQVVPQPVEPGPAPFDTYYVQHVGHRQVRSDRPVPGRCGQSAADHRALQPVRLRPPTATRPRHSATAPVRCWRPSSRSAPT